MIQCECKKSTASNSCQQQTAHVCRISHKCWRFSELVHMHQLQAVLPWTSFCLAHKAFLQVLILRRSEMDSI